MDLRNLTTFIQVAELGSFTRAAEKLGYSQPTVSLQIKQLEQEIGVQLFERIGHTVYLTDAGQDALAYAQNICQLSQEMVSGSYRHQKPAGNIRLAMADSLCIPLIIKGFSEFRQTYPKVTLHVVTAGTGDLLNLMDHNEVDMVFTLDNHVYNSAYEIASEKKVGVHFVASTNNPLAALENVTISDLISYPFLLTERGMSYRRLLDEHLARNSLEIHPVLEIGRTDLICRLVEDDMGISFLPDYVTDSSVEAKQIVRLPFFEFEVELWMQLLYRRDKWMSLPMQAAIRHFSNIMTLHSES